MMREVRSFSSFPATMTFLSGRRVRAAFSFLQRIGKGATTDVWLNPAFHKRFVADEGICWAAVRHVELLQEAGNLAIDDLDVADTRRAFQAMMRMRAGGYRLTMIFLGDREASAEGRDELALVDQKLREEVTRIANLLYMKDLSVAANAYNAQALAQGTWSCAEALPHLVQTACAKGLFKPERVTANENAFLSLLETLPVKHIVHETAVALVLPDATKEKNWLYIALGENAFASFQRAMTTVLEGLDPTMAPMRHMRGYGDRWPVSAVLA